MSGDLRAPIFTTAWDLCVWVVRKARAEPHDPLARALCTEALRLLDAVTLAVKNIDRETALLEADVILVRLRLRLRLAAETGLFDERQAQYALGLSDDIGRQIGGWKKTL